MSYFFDEWFKGFFSVLHIDNVISFYFEAAPLLHGLNLLLDDLWFSHALIAVCEYTKHLIEVKVVKEIFDRSQSNDFLS